MSSTLSPPPPPPPTMESVLFKLHQQLCTRALRNSSARFRNLLERALLVLAVSGFGILLMAHWSFVHRGVAVSSSSVYAKSGSFSSIPTQCLASIPGFQRDGVDVTHLRVWEDADEDSGDSSGSSDTVKQQQQQQQPTSAAFLESPLFEAAAAVKDEAGACSMRRHQQDLLHNATRIVYSFSHIEGYLLLPPHIARQRNLTIQHVVVAKNDVHCFGEPFLQQIVRLIGPETVVINWILGGMVHTPLMGFVYNPRTNAMTDLQESALQSLVLQHQSPLYYSAEYAHYMSSQQPNSKHHHHHHHTDHDVYSNNPYYSTRQHPVSFKLPWHFQLTSKLAVVMKTCFLYYIATTLISFTLCETQERMLQFTHDLQTQVRQGQTIKSLVIAHLLENLVFVPQMIGLCFFLIELYQGDKFLAFCILSLVWIFEAFSVIR